MRVEGLSPDLRHLEQAQTAVPIDRRDQIREQEVQQRNEPPARVPVTDPALGNNVDLLA